MIRPKPTRPLWSALQALWLASALVAAQSALAQGDRALLAVEQVPIEGDGMLVTLQLSEAAPQPTVFTIDDPARLSLDLVDTRLALTERYTRFNTGNLRAISSAEAGGRTRVVFELTELVPYDVQVSGNRVQVRVGGSAGARVTGPSSAGSSSLASTGPKSISNIDFRRGEQGEGRVVVTLSDARTTVDVQDQGGKIVARFRDTQIPEALRQRLDVLDFATPVKFVDALSVAGGTDIVLTPVAGSEFEQIAYQTGNQFLLELQPLTPAEVDERELLEPQYEGERITLSFQSVDVRSLLQIVADVAGTNMVVSDSVQGEIAMRLENVPWDQALDIILQSKGLGKREEGNVILVAPIGELAERDRVEIEAQKQQTELSPLRSELLQVNYAKAADMAALLSSAESSLLSERGRVTIDQRTNTLLILETRERLGEIRDLITRLDVPVKQVLIESRIVIANQDYSRELGARFGVQHVNTVFQNDSVGVSGSLEGSNYNIGTLDQDTLEIDEGLNFNLPASSSAGAIGLSILGADYLIDLELSALQAEGRGEVVSSPRVIAANSTQASIEQGVEIPYQEASSSGATAVQFKKAVLSLNVTPQITPDNRIIMDLQVNNDSVGENFVTSQGASIPSIDTRKVATQVLVDNGQTVVLGGIYQQENRSTINKIPILGDIPILGAAFRNKSVTNDKAELLIFVSPRIIDDALRIN